MSLAARIFKDLHQFLRPGGCFSEKQASRWISVLVLSESESDPFIEITDDYISSDILDLWKNLKRKIEDESTKRKLDSLMEKWARKIFMKTKKSTHSRSRISLVFFGKNKTQLFENIHRDLRQFLDPEDTIISEALVLTWIQLLQENLENENTMTIPDQCISDNMLSVWMGLKGRFMDQKTKNVIENIWGHYTTMIVDKTKKEKKNQNFKPDPPTAETHQTLEERLFLSPSNISVASTPPSNLTNLSSVSDVSMNTPASLPSVSDVSMNTPASVFSDVSVLTAASLPSVGSPSLYERILKIPIVDQLGNQVDVFQYQKSNKKGRGFCLTGKCGAPGRPMKENCLQTLHDHARQEHSMKVEFKWKTGKICKPLICPFCSTDFIRKQTLRNHLKSHHRHYQLDDETVNRIVAIVDDEKLVTNVLPPNIFSLIEEGLNLPPTTTTASSAGPESQPMVRPGTTTISVVQTPAVTNNQGNHLEPSYTTFSSGNQGQPVNDNNIDGIFSEIPNLMELLGQSFDL